MLEIAGSPIPLQTKRYLEIPVARLPTQTPISIPVTVVNGAQEGARLWLSAAIHGDELNGVEIIRQVLTKVNPHTLRGTLITVPIVNVFGFIEQSRYLPDRRDLNRSFPGSPTGSLAARIANLFMQEIVSNSTHGIDLHTASHHRTNLPQIRANLNEPETRRCAEVFRAPVMIHADTRDGSLREAVAKQHKPILLYEGGEALRFDPEAIEVGVAGILRVMDWLDMLSFPSVPGTTLEVEKTRWIRANRSGILRLGVSLGEQVRKRQSLGTIADAFGQNTTTISASTAGMVIGHTQNPLVNQGDGIVHLAVLAS